VRVIPRGSSLSIPLENSIRLPPVIAFGPPPPAMQTADATANTLLDYPFGEEEGQRRDVSSLRSIRSNARFPTDNSPSRVFSFFFPLPERIAVIARPFPIVDGPSRLSGRFHLIWSLLSLNWISVTHRLALLMPGDWPQTRGNMCVYIYIKWGERGEGGKERDRPRSAFPYACSDGRMRALSASQCSGALHFQQNAFTLLPEHGNALDSIVREVSNLYQRDSNDRSLSPRR